MGQANGLFNRGLDSLVEAKFVDPMVFQKLSAYLLSRTKSKQLVEQQVLPG
jgi:hypothetical protein